MNNIKYHFLLIVWLVIPLWGKTIEEKYGNVLKEFNPKEREYLINTFNQYPLFESAVDNIIKDFKFKNEDLSRVYIVNKAVELNNDFEENYPQDINNPSKLYFFRSNKLATIPNPVMHSLNKAYGELWQIFDHEAEGLGEKS